MIREIRLEALIGATVRGLDGELVGRIHDVSAEWRGTTCIVTELHLQRDEFVARITPLRKRKGPLRVPWGAIDWTDPSKPRLRVATALLESTAQPAIERATMR